MGRGRHANPATGAFGGAPCGATILVRGVPKWGGAAMRTLPLRPSVEFPLGHKRVRDVPKNVVGKHAGPGTGAFGGAPYGATKRVRGVPKWGGGVMRTFPLGP